MMAEESITKFNNVLYNYQNQTYKSGFIFDFWSCSSAEKDSNGKKFPGAYPKGFLKRVQRAFYEVYPWNREQILHVCAGRIDKKHGLTLDISEEYQPDILANAEDFANKFLSKYKQVKFCLSDSPYNEAAAEKYYNCKLLNKSKMFKEMIKVTEVGGFIGILDQSTQWASPRNVVRVALIAITSIPNLDVRCFTVYQKVKE